LAAPVAPASVPRANVGAPRVAARSITGLRILLIDDDDDTREGLAVVLAHQGADVRTASSAAGGFASIAEIKPDVILCDIAMPTEDGYSFIRKLRSLSREKGGQIPAAALTALAGEADRREATGAGFQMHLAKPVDAARLIAAVGLLLARQDAPAPSQQP
jgi:CheY-like chemotaxis protein